MTQVFVAVLSSPMVEDCARHPVVPDTNPPATEEMMVTPPAAVMEILPEAVWVTVITVPTGKATEALVGTVIEAGVAPLDALCSLKASLSARV